MESGCFYLERGKRMGPVDLTGLLKVLLATSDPRTVKVWRQGLADWQHASTVLEVAATNSSGGQLIASSKGVLGKPRWMLALIGLPARRTQR